jgi:hypothetical protein
MLDRLLQLRRNLHGLQLHKPRTGHRQRQLRELLACRGEPVGILLQHQQREPKRSQHGRKYAHVFFR